MMEDEASAKSKNTSANSEEWTWALKVEANRAQNSRKLLEEQQFLDDSWRLSKLEDGYVALPIKAGCISVLLGSPVTSKEGGVSAHQKGMLLDCELQVVRVQLPPSKKKAISSPYATLKSAVQRLLEEAKVELTRELGKEIPRKWEKHDDMAVLPASSFQAPVWASLPNLWHTVAAALKCKRLARRSHILADDFRTPKIELLMGSDPIVQHKDNGILYSFDVRYSMFSVGNITEKLRVASFKCRDETVVDLYAGIGYFTLPYLVHAGAKLVYACEWNPHAAQALQRNLQLNGVADRCVVLHGDNRQVCPKGVANRVNLGLIPSSEDGWPVACAALKTDTGGVLHIHSNVTSYPCDAKCHSDAVSCPNTKCIEQKRLTVADHCDLVQSELMDSEPPVEQNSTVKNLVDGRQTVNCGPAAKDQVFRTSAISGNGGSATPDGSRTVQETDSADNDPQLDHNDTSQETGRQDASPCVLECGKKSSGTSRTANDKVASNISEATISAASYETKNVAWNEWARNTAIKIKDYLNELHRPRLWKTTVLHIEHVKSYAPHVDHLVLDVLCKPV